MTIQENPHHKAKNPAKCSSRTRSSRKNGEKYHFFTSQSTKTAYGIDSCHCKRNDHANTDAPALYGFLCAQPPGVSVFPPDLNTHILP